MKRNVELILKQGFVSRGFLGITFAPDPIADALQIPGVIVYGIVRNSPAEAAGATATLAVHLRACPTMENSCSPEGVRPMLNGTIGDVITSMDAKTIRTGADVFRLLDKRVLAFACTTGPQMLSHPLISQVPGDIVALGLQRFESQS